MKSLITLLVITCLTTSLNAQESVFVCKNEKFNEIRFKNVLLTSFQFGSLFKYDVKYYLYKRSVVKYYDDYDFGLKMKIKYKLLEQLHINAIYNLGLVRFNFAEAGHVSGPNMKLSINYKIEP